MNYSKLLLQAIYGHSITMSGNQLSPSLSKRQVYLWSLFLRNVTVTYIQSLTQLNGEIY